MKTKYSTDQESRLIDRLTSGTFFSVGYLLPRMSCHVMSCHSISMSSCMYPIIFYRIVWSALVWSWRLSHYNFFFFLFDLVVVNSSGSCLALGEGSICFSFNVLSIMSLLVN